MAIEVTETLGQNFVVLSALGLNSCASKGKSLFGHLVTQFRVASQCNSLCALGKLLEIASLLYTNI